MGRKREREKRKQTLQYGGQDGPCTRCLSVYEHVTNCALYLHISPTVRGSVQWNHVANVFTVMTGLEVGNRGSICGWSFLVTDNRVTQEGEGVQLFHLLPPRGGKSYLLNCKL